MKKIVQIFALLFLIGINAQAPEKFSYQAVVRNASNALVTNAPVGIKISLLKSTSTGTVVYAETQTATTNANGLISVQIGAGTVISGTIAGIDWATDSYYIKTETDPTGGTSYTIAGTSQLLSVPYALYAKNAGSGAGFTLPYEGTDGGTATEKFKIINTSTNSSNAGYFENTSDYNVQGAIRGVHKSTGFPGIGVYGIANVTSNGSVGVKGLISGFGPNTNGAGVLGEAYTSTGVRGNSTDGKGVYGYVSGNIGVAGFFESTQTTGKALETSGKIKLGGIGEGAGKVLTSDAQGNATWETPTTQTTTPKVHFTSTGGIGQIIPQNLYTDITSWENIEQIGGSNYNTTTGVYTIPNTGYYSIRAQILLTYLNTTTSASALKVDIYVDGASAKFALSNYAGTSQQYGSTEVFLEKKFTAGQQIKIAVYQNGRVTNNLSENASTFSIHLIH